MLTIVRYDKEKENVWNEFLSTSKNSSFLFNRNFMDYHKDRFEDHSLLIYRDGNLVSLLPANLNGGKLFSHQGLSYGAFIFHNSIKLNAVIEIICAVLEYLNSIGIKELIYKAIPRVYNTIPSDEIEWALFILNAELIRRDTAIVVSNHGQDIPYQERRIRSIKKARKLNPIISKEGIDGFSKFWNVILEPNILQKHGVKPVHTVDEIILLAKNFPDNIVQYNTYVEGIIMAGCTMFLNKNVAHAQYISGSQIGRDNGCLDHLFDYLIKTEFSGYTYFDFGICNENAGQGLNRGLLDWKEGFGGRTVSHDFYKVNTENFILLKCKIE